MAKDSHEFDLQSLSRACKALAHPARLTILQTLAQRGTCICGELVEVLPLSQATVSQHLKVLRGAGLISGEIEGPRSCYCINEDAVRRLGERLGGLFSSLDRCCRGG